MSASPSPPPFPKKRKIKRKTKKSTLYQHPTMESNPVMAVSHATVQNEGCTLHYWSQGAGPKLILFVPGGNGHGRQFNNIMSFLTSSSSSSPQFSRGNTDQQFTCATFDRRQMSSSSRFVNPDDSPPKKLSPYQQARDIRAVVLALGFTKVYCLFGSSSGGIFWISIRARLSRHGRPLRLARGRDRVAAAGCG